MINHAAARVAVAVAVMFAMGPASAGNVSPRPIAERAPLHAQAYGLELQATWGASGMLKLIIRPIAPWALPHDTAFEAAIEPTAHVALAKHTFDAADLQDIPDGAYVQATATLGSDPLPDLKVCLNFFVCTGDTCERHRENVTLPIGVEQRTAPSYMP